MSRTTRSDGIGVRATAQIEPSHSPPARTGTTRRGSIPSGPAGTKIGSLERAIFRKTPQARRCAVTCGGTRRPTIVETRAGSVASCGPE
ncbi:hypothetical protein [Actinomadura algeriensis]|uniref:Uncharacterized protein n=1 Tax=Actinomadura algeriensis TaxID=1679523 RepID=A0ABR9JMI6_9ACTN|nr:hypothetical protein [Actinomadura algeriensis]MBE1531777.1 hypothetical protein [Actinomadura algeriensis]